MKKLLMLPLVAGLAGCGGASTSTSNEFAGLISDYVGLTTIIGNPESPSISTTPEEDLPMGEVTYSGAIILSEAEVPAGDAVFAALGAFSATIDFADPDGATGRATDFFEVLDPSEPVSSTNGAPISGELTYSGTTDRVTGSLTKRSGEVASYDMDVLTSPGGPGGEYFAGFGEGPSTADGRDSNIASYAFFGER